MRTVGPIVGAILAIIIAWWLVTVLLGLVWFIAKLIIVAVVAVLVYFALRGPLARRA